MMASTEPDVELQKVCAAAVMPCKETSPDSKCPICLDHFRNVSYADRCFHRFCFRCILEWGKNKAECPLCKQPFSSVYHSVRSEHDFKVYELRPAENGSFGSVQGQRFRYRTTLTHRRRWTGQTHRSSRQQEVMRFRRWLYRCDVRVHGVRDGGRSRDMSAEFFRKNPACLHRLVPWLKRELAVLYGSHDSVADVVLHLILSMITRHDIQDEAFLRELRPFLSSRTEHFLHEFLSFAKSPFNMEAYDRHAVYDCPAPSHVSAVSEDDGDLSSAPFPWDDETPGPSYSSATHSVFTVTISDSDVDSASEEEEAESVSINANSNVTTSRADEEDYSSDGDCVIIGFIKPNAQRTPELVHLSSDSEASAQEDPQPPPSNKSDRRDLTNRRSMNRYDILSHSATKHNSTRRDGSRDWSRDWSRDGSRDWSRGGSRDGSRDWSRDGSRDGSRDWSRGGSRDGSRDWSKGGGRDGSRDWSRGTADTRTHTTDETCHSDHVHAHDLGLIRAQILEPVCLQGLVLIHARDPGLVSSSHSKPKRKRKHKSLQRTRTRRSKDKHHVKKKEKKKKRRRSLSTEVSAERRKHHKKKKKHKTARKYRSERTGQSSEGRSPTVINIPTETQSAEELLSSSCGASSQNTASNSASDETLLNDSATLRHSS
ncbi:topoisomerase I binding, arginine/serine-rich a [Tachysurus ichikawai]